MEIAKIIGIGFITLIITLILKEYRREYAVFSGLIGGIIILYMVLDTFTRSYRFYKQTKQELQYRIYWNFIENYRNININRIRCEHLQR